MSGVCGVVGIAGAPLAADALEPALRLLEQRGPDGLLRHSSGTVALGHALLATTPEALVEPQLFTDPGSGCTITADARIDNREELLPALIAADAQPGVIGDAELILRAYLAWGLDFVERLVGDFAFAIHDPGSDTLVCARDRTGMRRLAYALSSTGTFVFATEPRAAAALLPKAPRIDEGRIADYLTGMERQDYESTFFEGIRRLPPAHLLTVCGGKMTLRRYWRLVPPAPLILPDESAYIAAFLEVFNTAVRCRLRAPAGAVAAMLSGGMDSGSIVAIASRIAMENGDAPLPTISGVDPGTRGCKETSAIRCAQTIPGIKPIDVEPARLGERAGTLARLRDACEEPFDANMDLVRGIYLAAADLGAKVVLDGAGGDLAFNEGRYIAQLLRSGHWRRAWNELRGQYDFLEAPEYFTRTLAREAWVAFVPARARSILKGLRERMIPARAIGGVTIRKSFSREIRLTRRAASRFDRTHAVHSLRANRAYAALSPSMVNARERYDRVASQQGIEPRDPFMDHRLIEFCLSIPPSWMLRQGWPKYLLRKAMSGLLPEGVIWNRAKRHLGPAFTEAVNLAADIPSKVGRDDYCSAERYVDLHQQSSAAAHNPFDSKSNSDVYFLTVWMNRLHTEALKRGSRDDQEC